MPIVGISLVVILVIFLIGVVPTQTDGRNWVRSGSGVLGAFLVVILLLTTSIRI